MELIESHGITPEWFLKRVKDGWELHEAMDATRRHAFKASIERRKQ